MRRVQRRRRRACCKDELRGGGGGENECVGGRERELSDGPGKRLPATEEGIWMNNEGTYCTVASSWLLMKFSFQFMAVLDVYLDLLSPL